MHRTESINCALGMNKTSIKYELQHILSGTLPDSEENVIGTITNYLRRSKTTGGMVETEKQFKIKETEELISFINKNELWVTSINFDLYLSEGAEQRVYIKNEKTVYKLNDSIYYTTWLDYFYNLLLNNYFFPDTAYKLIDFFQSPENILYALVEQPYVKANQITDLQFVRNFMKQNGFINTRNNDYYNPDLGVILEDLHDENVLTQNNMLYFIDTVFYIKHDIFWEK